MTAEAHGWNLVTHGARSGRPAIGQRVSPGQEMRRVEKGVWRMKIHRVQINVYIVAFMLPRDAS